MEKKKRSLIIVLALSLVALLVVGGTMAWFTDEEKVDNSFTAGTVDITIDENGFNDVTNWNPGDCNDKEVKIISNGSKCTRVRVSLTPVWGDMVDGEFVADGNLGVDNICFKYGDALGTDWVYNDGWFYYTKGLEQDDETSLLLKQVCLKGNETGNEYQGKTLRVNVTAEAVQCSHDAYKDAWGITAWPPDHVTPVPHQCVNNS